MNSPSINTRFLSWEKWIGYVLLATTSLIISPATVDSFLMPKHVWVAVGVALWYVVISQSVSLKSLFGSAVDWPVAFLLVAALVSIVVDYHSGIQLRSYMHLFVFVLLFYAYRRFWQIGACPYFATGILMLTSTLLAVYGILQDYGFDFVMNSGGVRDWRAKVVATVGNPNFLAEYLAICLPCILGFGLRRNASWGAIFSTSIVLTLLIACHTVTFCVGATMAYSVTLIITLAAALWLRQRPQFSFLRLGAFVILMASAAGWYLLDNTYNSHGQSLYKEAWQSPQWWSGAGSRVFNWRTSRYMVEDEPLTGIGFGNYLTQSIHYQGINYERQGRPHDRDYVIAVDQPHFQLLETTAEAGLPGCLALIWLTLAGAKAGLRRLRREEKHSWFAWGCWGGMWIAIVHSFANFPFHVPGSSLLFVALSAYLFSDNPTGIAYAGPSPRAFSRVVVALLALLLCIMNYAEYLGNQYLRQGMELQQVGTQSGRAAALYYLDLSRRLDPFSFQTYYWLGAASLEMNWPKEAEKHLRTALVYQEDLNIHKILVKMALAQKNIPAAIAEQRRVLELNPAYPGHYFELAALLRQAGQEDEAKRLESRSQELQNILDGMK